MGNEQSATAIQADSRSNFNVNQSNGITHQRALHANEEATVSFEDEKEEVCKKYEISSEDYDTAMKLFAAFDSNDKHQKWILTRTRQLLFSDKQVTFMLYLQLIQWWKTSSDQSKLQYVFHFLDLDADGFVTLLDLIGALERLIENYQIRTGDFVALKANGKKGIVRYVGPKKNTSKSATWIGIEFSNPYGNMNGIVKDHMYFECLPKHGMLVPEEKCVLWSVCLWVHSIFSLFSPPLPPMNVTDDGFEANPFLRLTWDMFADRIMNDTSILEQLHLPYLEYVQPHSKVQMNGIEKNFQEREDESEEEGG